MFYLFFFFWGGFYFDTHFPINFPADAQSAAVDILGFLSFYCLAEILTRSAQERFVPETHFDELRADFLFYFVKKKKKKKKKNGCCTEKPHSRGVDEYEKWLSCSGGTGDGGAR